MSGAAVIATHPAAGRVEPVRLAVRVREPGAAAADAPAPLVEASASGAAPPFGPRGGSARAGALELRLEALPERDAAVFAVVLRNAGDRAIHCESAVAGLRWRAPGLGGALRFLRHGWQSWSFTGARDLDAAGEPAFPSGPWLRGLFHALPLPPADRAGWHESDLLTVAGVAPAGPACCVGVLERGGAFGVLYARREGDAVRIEAELWLDAVLAPGEERALDPLRIALGTDANALLEAHADAHGRHAGARTAHPFVSGWCSWYHLYERVGEADVLRSLEALAAARDALPVEVVQIDDGWQRAVGDWRETSPGFPRGTAPLAREIRAAGFVPGLWTAPFCAVSGSDVARAHPEWLLRRDGEPLVGIVHPTWSPGAVHVLDPSREAVREHLRALYAELVEQGFGYLKLDFLYAPALAAESSAPGLARAGRLRRGLEAIRAGAGPEVFLLGCGSPLGAAVGVVDGMRIGPDVAPHWLPAPPLVAGIEASQPSARNAVRSIAARAFLHRRLWQNDPDCFLARTRDTQLSAEERRTLAAAVAASGGLALFSDDVAALGPEERAFAREAIGLARRVDALGIPARVRAIGPLDAGPACGLAATGTAAAFVALANVGDAPAERAIPAEILATAGAPPEPLLGSPPPAKALPAANPGAGASARAVLAPHASAFYRVPRAVRLAVFCDFDGTFSVQDVGATIAQRLAPERRPRVWARYERGELTAWQYNLEILDRLPMPLADLEAFLRTIELDPGARPLVEWCESRGVPFRVLSDGFDLNLNRLQVLHGLRFAYDANHLRYESGRWRIAASHPNPACGCGTGTCKRGRIEAFRRHAPEATTVHIGNGRVSDLCGALAADVAFAKDSLATELARRDVAFERFETLLDVIPRLAGLLDAARP